MFLVCRLQTFSGRVFLVSALFLRHRTRGAPQTCPRCWLPVLEHSHHHQGDGSGPHHGNDGFTPCSLKIRWIAFVHQHTGRGVLYCLTHRWQSGWKLAVGGKTAENKMIVLKQRSYKTQHVSIVFFWKKVKIFTMEETPRNQAVPSLCFGICITVCIEGQYRIKRFQYGSLIAPKPRRNNWYVCSFGLKILRVSQCKVGREGETCPVIEGDSHSLVRVLPWKSSSLHE